TTTGGTATVSVPTHSDGDLLMWLFSTRGAQTTPTGWHLALAACNSSGTDVTGYVWTRVASSEPGSYTAPGSPTAPSSVMLDITGSNGSTTLDAAVCTSGTANTV